MRFSYCFFDLDGTLTDPGTGITNSVMYALRKFGITVEDRRTLYPFIGPPLLDSFRDRYGFSGPQSRLALEYYREYFRDRGIFENEVYDGIPGLLGELRDRGITVALATSKPYEFSVQILEHFGLSGYFDHVCGATMDESISRKADVIALLLGRLGDIDRNSVLMVGDRDQDIDGARANGLRSAGVLWGYGSEEELRSAGADYLVRGPEELLEVITAEET